MVLKRLSIWMVSLCLVIGVLVVFIYFMQLLFCVGPIAEFTDPYKYPTIVISSDGKLFRNGVMLSDQALVDLVKTEVEKSYFPENENYMCGLFFVETNKNTNYDRIQEVKHLITNNGGYWGRRLDKSERKVWIKRKNPQK